MNKISIISSFIHRFFDKRFEHVLANSRQIAYSEIKRQMLLFRLATEKSSSPYVKTYSNNPLVYPSFYNELVRFILDKPIYHGNFSYDNPLGCREYMPEQPNHA